ncbi:MAG: hypothetical protein IPJ81_08330 [Chitinophagaceae bacterium]|nr:hypothetical protein [Chitinophagaceae bacterium]
MIELEEKHFKELGFVNFVPLHKADYDGIKRLAWMQVFDNEIITIRITHVNNDWIIDYVSPEKYNSKY